MAVKDENAGLEKYNYSYGDLKSGNISGRLLLEMEYTCIVVFFMSH